MPSLEVNIQNGGLGRPSTNTDKWGGLFVEQTAMPSLWAENEVKKILKIEDLASFGIVKDATDQNLKLAYWHASEVFRVAKLRGQNATLFVQLATVVTDLDVINKAFRDKDDRVRKFAYVFSTVTLADAEASDLHDSLELLWGSYVVPARGIVSYKKDIADAIPDFSAKAYNRVMVDVANDLTTDGIAKAIFDGTLGMCGAAGTQLGQRLGLSVHQKSSWRAKPINSDGTWVELGDINGDSTEKLTPAEITNYDTLGVVAVTRQIHMVDAFFSNSRMACTPSDDYATINNGETIDKAAYLSYIGAVESLDRPIYADPATGKIAPESVSLLQSVVYNEINSGMVIGKTGDSVEVSVDLSTGSLSIESVYVDPDQDFLTTEEIIIEVRIVIVGAAKAIVINIGVTANL